MRWRTLLTAPLDGADNMALDDALMRRAAASGECIFRVYGWARPTLSLGRNQPARDAYDLDRARAAGVDFVRRPTGGRAVLHHREVTYSVAAPEQALGDLRSAYDAINVILVEALRALGADARAAEPAGVAPAHAEAINTFYEKHFNGYLNFHRPCGHAELVEGRQRQAAARVPMVCNPLGSASAVAGRSWLSQAGTDG